MVFSLNCFLRLGVMLLLPGCLTVPGAICAAAGPGARYAPSAADEIIISMVAPDPRGGKAYKLVYRVEAPLSVYWRFKTDFDNDFLETSPFIHEHRVIRQSVDEAVTENRYAQSPDVFFRWRTTLLPRLHRMDFVLLNPGEVRQKFHYGYIQLRTLGQNTLVTQVAYFDFSGVSLWTLYPWGGGMTDFLLSTARWEQETVLRLKTHYQDGDPSHSDAGKRDRGHPVGPADSP